MAEGSLRKQTLDQLRAALGEVSSDLSPRVEELAQKSTDGQLTLEEHQEYAEIVRLNDMLSLLRFCVEALETARDAGGAPG